jgi:hypothetical protein
VKVAPSVKRNSSVIRPRVFLDAGVGCPDELPFEVLDVLLDAVGESAVAEVHPDVLRVALVKPVPMLA